MSSKITVHYPFHPFHPLVGMALDVISPLAELPVTVRGPDGLDLKIPRWMAEPGSSEIALSEVATLPIEALHTVSELIAQNDRLPPAAVRESFSTAGTNA